MIKFSEMHSASKEVVGLGTGRFDGSLLVTSGNSELGAALGRLLHDAGMSVAVQCDLPRHRQDGVRSFPIPLLDPEFADRIAELRPDVILHCHGDAATTNRDLSPFESFCVTFDRVAAICEVTRKAAGRARLVLLSPDSARWGTSSFAAFATMCEPLFRECGRLFGVNCTLLETGQLFGAGLRGHAVYEILFRLHGPGRETILLPFGENEELDLLHAGAFADMLPEALSVKGARIRIEGTRIRAHELVELLASLTETSRPYRFAPARDGNTSQRGDVITVKGATSTELDECLKAFAEWWLGRR